MGSSVAFFNRETFGQSSHTDRTLWSGIEVQMGFW